MSNILSEVHPELVAEWSDKNLPLTPDRITYGSNKVVWWKGACGHEWQTSVKARSNGENCPICSGARVIEGINDLATLKPELADEWSSKNDPLKPTMVTTGSHKKVIWQDKYGHEWTATVKSRALNGTGCPYCSHNKVLVGFNDLASQRPQIASEWSERNYPLKPDMVDAMKRQAGRPSKENGATVLPHLQGKKSREILAAESGESHEQIRKYIRLTNLVPELLEFVDEGRIKMRPAVELSYLNEDCQRDLVDEIDLNDCTPSHDQAIRMRKFFEEGKLTTEAISAIMSEEKPNQREKIVLRGDRVRSLIPKNIPINQTEEYVCKALEHYNKFLRNRAERDSR